MTRAVDVLYLIGQLSVGGTERQLLLLAQHLNRSKFRPSVICLSEHAALAGALQKLDCQTFVLRRATDGRLKTLLQTCLLARQVRPRVLHCFGYASRAGILASAVSGTPSNVLSIRLDPQWASRWNWLFYRFAVSWADIVLANSFQTVSTLASKGLRLRTPPRVIYNGLDTRAFDRLGSEWSADLRDGHSTNGGPSWQTICVVSNLRPPKCIDQLLEAFAIVVRSAPETRLWVVGDGPLRGNLEDLTKRLALEDRVVFWGMRSNVPAILRHATIGVNSSRNEGLANAIIECMAARLPVVATTVGGTPELVVHGETGLLVPPNDPPALAEALLSLLRSPETARRLGAEGRRRVEEHFTVERMVAETEAVYEALLSNDHRARLGASDFTLGHTQ
jgi:glycosyltransferase involved in cell wall biosynthesis